MKRYLLLFLLLLFTQKTFAQYNVWRWQNPSVQGNTLNAVQMITLKKTYACGNRGTFIKTSDGGKTWDVHNLLLNDSLNLSGMNFLDSNYGMVCGGNGIIFKTTDGGNTWIQLSTLTKAALDAIVVVDSMNAIAVGELGGMIKTVNGGLSWAAVPLENSLKLKSIRKLRPNFITITGANGSLYKSLDTGSSWEKIIIRSDSLLFSNDIYGQVFYNDSTGIVVGDLGSIYTTTNGGNIWANRSVGNISAATLRSIDSKDPAGNIYSIVGEYGAFFSTATRGNTWNHIILGIADSMNSISYFDKLNAIAVGRDGIILNTSDGGETWRYLPSKPFTPQLNSIAFPKGDTSLGIAVGRFSAIMRTTNGGAHWDVIPNGTSSDLFAVTFLNSTEVCAVGQYGTILRSHDAGVNWISERSGTAKYFKGVSFPNPNFGWAVGDSGIVAFTVDGGSSWTIYPFSKRKFFTGVVFPDSLHGYICSDHGVYTTTDGGVTWSDPDDITYYLHCTGISSPSANRVSISYYPCQILADPSVSGVLLEPGGVMTSTDGGTTWANAPFYDLLHGIFFTDDLHGTVVGIYYPGKQPTGFIAHTIDGGKSWVQQDSHTSDDLYGVAFGTNKAGTAIGTNGNIIRITTNE